MLTLHHLERSRSSRILWLFEELGLEYEIKSYPRDPTTSRAPAELRKIHPLGKAPIVTDGELALAETGAIIEYILEKYGEGRLQPDSSNLQARQDYRFFMHYAEGSLMPPLLLRLIFDKLEEAKLPFFVKPIVSSISGKVNKAFIAGEMSLHSGFLVEYLQQREWLAGDSFTAADIQMSYPIEALLNRGRLSAANQQALQNYLGRLQARPAYQTALQKGGPTLLEKS